STGVYGYPVDEAARVSLDAAASFLRANHAHIDEVRVVLFDNRALQQWAAGAAAVRGERRRVVQVAPGPSLGAAARDASAPPYTRIYGGRLEEFVQRRDTLARELRSSGERDAANAVKALRKPSRIAWALDQGAIEMPGSLAALADAAADLVTAQSSGGDARAA